MDDSPLFHLEDESKPAPKSRAAAKPKAKPEGPIAPELKVEAVKPEEVVAEEVTEEPVGEEFGTTISSVNILDINVNLDLTLAQQATRRNLN